MRDPQDIRALVQLRLAEAQVLADNRHPAGAFYLAGYSVELLLKAKVAERMGLPWLFDEKIPPGEQFNGLSELRKLVKTHNLVLLLVMAGLKTVYVQRQQDEPAFFKYRQLLESWNEGLRYQLPAADNEANTQRFLNFLTGPDGFLQWIEQN